MTYQLFRVGALWHYRRSIDGKRVQRSTRETDRQRAEQVAERALREAKLWARGGREIPTLRELITQWIIIHEASASRAHVKVVETLGRLHLHGLGDTPIDKLTTDRVELARVRHLETHAPVSANQWLKVLRLLCNWAVRRGVIPAVPFRVKALKIQKKPRATLPASLVQDWLTIIDKRKGSREGVRTAIRLMLGLGLRESETISARWEWLDVERHVYTPGRTKGREAVPLPVPDWLFSYLLERRQAAGLMLAKSNGKPYTPGFTRSAMLEANRAVGAPHITAHRLRGTFATQLSRMGVPVQDIQRVLRHKNLTTTAAYLEIDMTTVIAGQRNMAEQIGFGLHVQPAGAPVANNAPQTQQ
ncbi:site-specific integrase [Paraburkholderia sp. Ac-20342]|uniref:tyrosine-type recombinase/integrase n=1 Tax=Paraburkholderia sp. Ac-20342 TaxID=2703889 RepID=UPI00197FE643|nr:site-specific integrase [Paraburkholderia sp. Ac-20342]MBN3848359.1 site-specific integrase [Paraburkholderia sp. Ac-20342]